MVIGAISLARLQLLLDRNIFKDVYKTQWPALDHDTSEQNHSLARAKVHGIGELELRFGVRDVHADLGSHTLLVGDDDLYLRRWHASRSDAAPIGGQWDSRCFPVFLSARACCCKRNNNTLASRDLDVQANAIDRRSPLFVRWFAIGRVGWSRDCLVCRRVGF